MVEDKYVKRYHSSRKVIVSKDVERAKYYADLEGLGDNWTWIDAKETHDDYQIRGTRLSCWKIAGSEHGIFDIAWLDMPDDLYVFEYVKTRIRYHTYSDQLCPMCDGRMVKYWHYDVCENRECEHYVEKPDA